MINIKIQKKDLWLLSAIIVFLVGIGYVIAYNANWQTSPGNPAIIGHTPDEIFKCGENETIKVVGGKWTCAVAGEGVGGNLTTSYICISSLNPTATCPGGKKIIWAITADISEFCSQGSPALSYASMKPNCISQTSCSYTGSSSVAILCQ